MADFPITPGYDPKLRKLETADPNHADVFNALFQRLNNNDAFFNELLKEAAPKLETLAAGTRTVTSAVKSPVNVKRIDGKTIANHIPLFDSGLWGYSPGAQKEVYTPKELRLTATQDYDHATVNTPINGGKTYTLSLAHDGYVGLNYLDAAGTVLYTSEYTQAQTVTAAAPAAATRARVWLSNTTGAAKTYVFKDLSLTEGTQAQPFVANVKGLTNPTIANETNGTSLVVPTTLYAGEYVEQNTKGELVKYKKFHEVELTGAENYVLHYRGTTHANVRIDNFTPGIKPGSRTVVKYNGAILQKNTVVGQDTSADRVYDPTNDSTGTLFIGIANADSGWGPSYYPTPEDMKAYMLGWRMADTSGAMYNRTDGQFKRWHPIVDKDSTTWNPTVGTEGSPTTDVVPTVTAPKMSVPYTWQPYRLLYELATPVQETIQPYSDLTLEKGANSIKVYAGRIVNEAVAPARSILADVWLINDLAYPSSFSKYKVQKTLRISRNSVPTNSWEFRDNNANGNDRWVSNAYTHDPTASYTLDYEPLYSWEVTAPIDAVQVAYFETLQAVANELVYDVAKQQDTMARMLENAINENEGVEGFNLTTINMTEGYVRVTKDRYGYVNVNIYFRSGVWSPGTLIAKLPVGYRPGFLRAAVGGLLNITPFSMTGTFQIDNAGDIRMAYDTKLVSGQSYTNINISGNALYKEGN